MVSKYQRESGNPKVNAQRNLSGRTHYVDDDTLRYFHSRITSTRVEGNGLLFCLIESVALDPENRRRGFRYVVFDLYGTVISNVDLDGCFSSSEIASKKCTEFLSTIDPLAVTREAAKNALETAKWEYDETMRMIR